MEHDERPYDERLSVPLRWWVQGTLLLASLWLALAVATPEDQQWLLWAVTALGVALLVGLLVSWGSPRVRVADGWFHAGPARIERRHVGTVRALDADETRRVSGRDADVRAYLMLRPYLKRSVRVEVLDPADPTPYWLVSTRHPEALASALGATTTPRGERPADAPG